MHPLLLRSIPLISPSFILFIPISAPLSSNNQPSLLQPISSLWWVKARPHIRETEFRELIIRGSTLSSVYEYRLNIVSYRESGATRRAIPLTSIQSRLCKSHIDINIYISRETVSPMILFIIISKYTNYKNSSQLWIRYMPIRAKKNSCNNR